MALKIRVTLTLALVSTSGAIRGHNQNPDDIKSLVSESVTICGNDDIWSDITRPTTVRGVKGIQWKEKDDIMKDYVGDHKGFVATADAQITKLKQKIEEKKGKATSREITKEEIESLVEKAVVDDESFGSIEMAQATTCGKPGGRLNGKRPPRDAFENSKDAMQEIAEGFFHAGVESNTMLFTKVCEDFLGFQRSSDAKADDLASYCDELCADMAKIAQTVSNNKGAGAATDLKKLQNELLKQELKREELFTKQKDCEGAIVKIDNFHAYLTKLQESMSQKHKAFQNAEWDLEDARDALALLTEQLLAQQAAVDKAKAGLTDLGQAAQGANDEMATADAQMQGASQSLEKVTTQWKELMADLEGVRAAEKYADEVKQRLSLLLMKMDGYVEECVREPVRNIGLSEETKVYDGEFFTWDVNKLPAKEDMNDALSAFHNYCETVAKGIFELVKDKVDLSPLCELQPQDDTLTEIVTTVQKRKDSVVDAIETVQSWLSPFKGTDVTPESEKPAYVDEGEPLGLRRVMGMQLETFYSGYLKKWKKHGEFLALLASITVAINELDAKVTAAADEMDKVAKELEAAQSQFETAVASFQEAQQAANLEKQELTEAMENLENQVKESKLNLDDLMKKVEQAKLAFKAAETLILTEHAAASASLTEKEAGIHRID